jgi:type I restriction enzyme M protein
VQLIDARAFWSKMRKSLGDKRKELTDAQIAEVTRLYAEFTESEEVKIFPNEAFGYQRITVERPLRLRWEIGADAVDRLAETKQWAKASEIEREDLCLRLRALEGAVTADKKTMAAKVGTVPKSVEKQLWDILGVADPGAPVITNRKGEPEPDPYLRDNENVRLPEIPVAWEADVTDRLDSIEFRGMIDHYMAAEVLPYVQDAWVDFGKTKIGYEIPLTRYFYKYVAPRRLVEIDAEIRALEAEVQAMLEEVTE